MGMEDFWEQLPTGKEDKPLLFEMGPLEYDFHDIDGLYFMLDRRLSGCLLMMWAKPMNPDIQGTVTLDSRVRLPETIQAMIFSQVRKFGKGLI